MIRKPLYQTLHFSQAACGNFFFSLPCARGIMSCHTNAVVARVFAQTSRRSLSTLYDVPESSTTFLQINTPCPKFYLSTLWWRPSVRVRYSFNPAPSSMYILLHTCSPSLRPPFLRISCPTLVSMAHTPEYSIVVHAISSL